MHGTHKLRVTSYSLLFIVLASACCSCDGFGDNLLMSNPSVARMAATSEEAASKLAPAERYDWAFTRYRIEASDLRRGIRWKNALKVRNSSERAARFLAFMEGLLASEEKRMTARESIRAHKALGEALSGGRWFRSGMEAAAALEREVEAELAPGRVDILRAEPGKGAPRQPGKETEWTVSAKRIVDEESAEGARKRYLIVLDDGAGTKLSREVSKEKFTSIRIGQVWRGEKGPGGEDPRDGEKAGAKGEGVRKG
jgi:hypothetical protein